MPDLSMSTLNLVFAGLSITCAVLSAVMFVLARRAAERDRMALGPRRIEAPRTTRARPARPARAVVVEDDLEIDLADDEEYEYVDAAEVDDEYEEYDDVEAEYEEYEEDDDDREYVTAETTASTARLPRGAEAALWAITETVPDPRNHLVLKDPTSEVRLHPILTGASSPAPSASAPPPPTPAADSAPADPPEGDGTLREGRMRGAIDETDVFTGEFFFAGEPKLNRF